MFPTVVLRRLGCVSSLTFGTHGARLPCANERNCPTFFSSTWHSLPYRDLGMNVPGSEGALGRYSTIVQHDIAPDRVSLTDDVFNKMCAVRRHLHRYPELSGEEKNTAAYIAKQLTALGVAHRTLPSSYGIVVDLDTTTTSSSSSFSSSPFLPSSPASSSPSLSPSSSSSWPTYGSGIIALRADIDALPIQEQTGLPFTSTIDGVMHACGHDGHTASLFGALHLLLDHRKRFGRLPAPVRLLFQPAEETNTGAKKMIDDGCLSGVAMIFGGHVDRLFSPPTIAVTRGAVNASSDTFNIHVHGKGGHSARPHECIDAVVAGSHIVVALQTIVSRHTNPAHPAVVTVGSFRSSTDTGNVIAGGAVLRGTLRSLDPAVRSALCKAVEDIAIRTAETYGATADVTFDVESGVGPVMNHTDVTAIARQAAVEAVGEANVCKMSGVNMGAEDFANYTEVVPACYVRYVSHLVEDWLRVCVTEASTE
eukprot:TRINITY_DN717_c0_g1_i2.p1 TRINITY_DN717_c0_g1~~TRINITY_DN717_c0_g1_i2.p1  ORF type:complete len:480 (+),score=66.89 TRINITY_DN717_c0_g1_i2:107-1546(+)